MTAASSLSSPWAPLGRVHQPLAQYHITSHAKWPLRERHFKTEDTKLLIFFSATVSPVSHGIFLHLTLQRVAFHLSLFPEIGIPFKPLNHNKALEPVSA
ncbi:hypothetical protein ElyMa_006863500 [Elysia marginata]|uniref:Uncharacterized protein n=1 Tax=Elysia marginata TaxID=1093978 RepID=A0AAV4J8B5_9GAST|nr:hypothetical protein ElyMa_006863500 [Elysia marginata]